MRSVIDKKRQSARRSVMIMDFRKFVALIKHVCSQEDEIKKWVSVRELVGSSMGLDGSMARAMHCKIVRVF